MLLDVRRWQVLVALILVTATPASAAFPPRPVSIGVVANFEHNLARSANLGWSRMDILWQEIQPTPGAWNIQPTMDRVNFALANGQQILAILHVVPSWLTSNVNIPPVTTTEWTAFVRRLAQELRGKVAAYEIWNEPDQKKIDKFGIGWGRNIEEPPLYTDFVHAAAVEIRAQAPGTLVVAPSFQSRNNADGADNRKRRILQQTQAAVYPDGPGHSFIDAISVHNNAGSTEVATTMGVRLNYENLAYFWNHAVSLRTKPVWVTEYGWRSNAVGEAEQRKRTCEVTKLYTASYLASSTHLDDWDVRRSFLFTLKDPNISNTLFRGDSSPKPVVTEYLQRFAYPAVQNPALPSEFPNCSGAVAGASSAAGSMDAATALSGFGLRDPGPAIPSGYSELAVESAADGRSTEVRFGDAKGGMISIFVSEAVPDDDSDGTLTEASSEWTSGGFRISVSGMRAGFPIGKRVLRSLSAALDPDYERACIIESVSTDESAVARFEFSSPKTPPGYTKLAAQIEYTSPTSGCGAEAAAHMPILDFTWTFEDAIGQVIRAGIYRYQQGFDATVVGDRSLHWSGPGGARYWVAADPAVVAPDQEALRSVAQSMDPAFIH